MTFTTGAIRFIAPLAKRNAIICRKLCSVTGATDPDKTQVKSEWFSISGFSKWASRKDLDLALGDLESLKVDPILDSQLFSSGKWAVLFPGISRSEVQKIVSSNNPKVIAVPLTGEELNNCRLASRNGITNCTVRFRNVPTDIGVEELRYFLQDYNLEESVNAVVPLMSEKNAKGQNHYLVNFSSPDEAERVVLEKCFTMLEGVPIQMFWYNC
jgi:hypothetical protein